MTELTSALILQPFKKPKRPLLKLLRQLPRVSALGFVLLTALINPFRLIALYSTDNRLRLGVLIPVVLLDLSLLFLASIGIWKPQSARIRTLHAVTWICVLSFALIPEGFLHLAIAMKIPQFLKPGLYTSPLHSDYWKLAMLWAGANTEKPAEAALPCRQDPVLGWVTKDSPENPLGTISVRSYQTNYAAPALLFFGDSFLRGATKVAETIPEQVGQLLNSQIAVHNFGVGGYGLDQSYLRFKEMVPRFKNKRVIFEIAMETPLRVVLPFRLSPKPYFTVQDGNLSLHTENLSLSPQDYLKTFPVSFSSFWGNLLLMQTLGTPKTDTLQRQKIKTITNKILQAVVADSKRENISLAFLLLYDAKQLESEIWEETLLKSELGRLNATVIDTKPALLKEINSEKTSVSDLYFAEDGHPTPLANQKISHEVVSWLKAR